MVRFVALGFVGSVVVLGCSAPAGEPQHHAAGQARSVAQRIVNGEVSVAAQDATVMIVESARPACTGTLIAPNLVLTARHCVSQPGSEEQECTSFGSNFPASALGVAVGVDADASRTVAKGKKIFVPKTSNMCSFDAAIIELDRAVPNAKLAKVRFSELAPNEPTVAVGYGVDENENEPSQRMQRATTVLGVGPRAIDYRTKDDASLKYDLPAGDVATGESTCFGDSGGPLFDARGAIVAITSRGLPDSPEGGVHGRNGCADAPSIFAGVKHNEKFIRETAASLGVTLQVAGGASTPTKGDEAADLEPSSTADDRTTGDGDGDADEDADDDEDASGGRRLETSAGATGCSAAPGTSADGRLALVALGLALLSRRRRTASSARSLRNG